MVLIVEYCGRYVVLTVAYCYRYVVLTVLDNTDSDGDGESDCLLGHVIIDLENLHPERGFHGSFPLSDMV